MDVEEFPQGGQGHSLQLGSIILHLDLKGIFLGVCMYYSTWHGLQLELVKWNYLRFILSPNKSWAALGHLWRAETVGYSLESWIFPAGMLRLTPNCSFLCLKGGGTSEPLMHREYPHVPSCSDFAQLCINVFGLSARFALTLNYFCSKAEDSVLGDCQPGFEGGLNRCPFFFFSGSVFFLHFLGREGDADEPGED